jgi:hypothetical protein
MNDFWVSWKKKTEVEKKAIKSVKKARELVINSIPKDKLVAIYIKGSFTRREMKKGSDVDIVPIVTEDKYQGKIFSVNNPEIDPVFAIPLSIKEFEDNTLHTRSNFKPDLRAEPDLLLLKLKDCKLIYGKALNPKKYPIRTTEQIVKDERSKIEKGYIKSYEKGKLDFEPLLKEVFWLVYWEQKAKGVNIKHSFKGIVNSVKDEGHIIHEAIKFRKGIYSKKHEKKFIQELKEYLIV